MAVLWLVCANLVLSPFIVLPIAVFLFFYWSGMAMVASARDAVIATAHSHRFGWLRREINKWRDF